jgi:beta-phosphoglucomutase-like phosphatase (HAD superfamily)
MPKHLITSNDVQHGKPNPADCIVVEDAPAGIRAGKAAGARVFALRTTAPDAELTESGADWIGNDLASLRLASSDHQSHLELILAGA